MLTPFWGQFFGHMDVLLVIRSICIYRDRRLCQVSQKLEGNFCHQSDFIEDVNKQQMTINQQAKYYEILHTCMNHKLLLEMDFRRIREEVGWEGRVIRD